MDSTALADAAATAISPPTSTPTDDEAKDHPTQSQEQQSIANSPAPHEHLKEHEKFQPIKLMKQKFTFTANRTRKKRSNV